jgi:hypothetical protein
MGWDMKFWKIVQPLEIRDGMLTCCAELTGERIMILSICYRQQLYEVFASFHTVLVSTAELVASCYDYTACGKILQSRTQT